MSNADSEKRYTGLVPDPTRPPPFFASENPVRYVSLQLSVQTDRISLVVMLYDLLHCRILLSVLLF